MADNKELENKELENNEVDNSDETVSGEDAAEDEQEEAGIAIMILKELSVQNKRLEDANIRLENANKKQSNIIYTLIIVIVLFVGGFLAFLSQYEFENYVQDGNGYNNINTGEQGDVVNGTSLQESETETR